MKKIFGFASVFALAAGFSLSSCSSDDVAEEVLNPSYNGQSIKTQFSISIPHGQKNSRMTTEATQSDAAFQGMKNIKVLTLKGTDVADDINSATPSGSFTLFDITKANEGSLSDNSNAKVYNDISIDVDVNRMLFYGASSAATTGKIKTNLYQAKNTPLKNIKFELEPRSAQSLVNSIEGKAILDYLTDLAKVPNFSSEQLGSEVQVDNPFKKFYDQLVQLKVASASHLKAFTQLLYTGVEAAKMPSQAGDGLEAAKALQTALKAAIVGDGKLFKENRKDEQNFAILDWNETTANMATIQNFPGNLNLPDGIASIEWSSTKFQFASQNLNGLTLDATKLTWPASLLYFVDSDLAVSDAIYSDLLIASDSWENIINSVYPSESRANGIVKPSTRSIAMAKQVNYGVARLETAVKIANGEVLDSKDFPVINNTEGYTITGILIGGQKSVGWDFTQKGDENWTIYDGNWKGGKALYGNCGAANSTLTFESELGTGEDNALTSKEAVYIAVEFVNDGNDFYGINDQIVKHGTKFYLTAKLDPTKTNVNEGLATKVLQQDYVTKASLTISSLKNAYVTIPDLRPSKMEFGMSVNLDWQHGFEFEQEFE